MATENKTCEEIEKAVLSDTELTEEQKKHIEACQSCKALLSTAKIMKEDLSSLSVPHLEEGLITQAVMKKIREEEPSPIKFKWTHHMGTVAAAVIILAAALIIKNPTPKSSEAANDNFSPLQTASEEADSAEEAYGTAPEAEANHTITALDTPDDGKFTRSVKMKTDNSAEEKESDAGEESSAAYDMQEDAEYDDSAGPYTLMFSENLIIPENSVDNENKNIADTSFLYADEYGGSAGGMDTTDTLSAKVFEGIVFSEGEENLDLNISLANKVLEEKHPLYIIKRETLEKLGYNNERFICEMSLITEKEFLESVGSDGTIFTEK